MTGLVFFFFFIRIDYEFILCKWWWKKKEIHLNRNGATLNKSTMCNRRVSNTVLGSGEDTRDLKPVVDKVIGILQSVSGKNNPTPAAVPSVPYPLTLEPESWEGTTTVIPRPDPTTGTLVTEEPEDSAAVPTTTYCTSCFCSIQDFCQV